jgi:hypothetical protein
MGKRIKSEKKGGGKNQSSLKKIHPCVYTVMGSENDLESISVKYHTNVTA